ncbi:MAG: hypothetical protein J7604_23395 [Sporocytophaga sp.]|uniref:hypothetical protein n=1 Tax=Sporocytophaga sp. TaxID=2231183 RepID=UPI001AFD43F6|nr:hypothetical protein [Sporocytophaga sp.]MBO9703179.1 hypothetical protein [Sporocytophaga sp.]
MTPKQIAIVCLSTMAGMVLAFVFNYFILDKILIPDPCYYHNHETNKIFDFFYNLPSSEGFHPFPSIFNFIFTMIIGAICGFILSVKKIKGTF